LVQIEIVGNDLAVVDLGQLDELHVHVADVRKILLHDLDAEMRHFLDALEDVQPAPAAIAFHRICGITMTPSRKPVSAISAMRPSMMTLVSRILKAFFEDFSPPKIPPRAARLS